jgi:hypothetical protein
MSRTRNLGKMISGNANLPTAHIDSDFTVNSNLFHVDADTDRVGIGTNTPEYKLDVNGVVKAGVAGNTGGNFAALLVSSAGDSSDQSAIAIQQNTFEGDTILFADYEPYVEYGINTDNSADTIDFTGGNATGNIGVSKVLYNRSGNPRTAYVKTRIGLTTGNITTGGTAKSTNPAVALNRQYNPTSQARKATWAVSFTGETSGTLDAVNTLGYPAGVKAIQVCAFWQIDGYGASGGADHANCIFGQSGASGGYFTSAGNVGDVSGSFIMTHDGDGVVAWGTYGWWHNGIIEVNSNGLIYYTLGNGYSGGTHYIRLQFYGWWE